MCQKGTRIHTHTHTQVQQREDENLILTFPCFGAYRSGDEYLEQEKKRAEYTGPRILMGKAAGGLVTLNDIGTVSRDSGYSRTRGYEI